jgi:hypothetical protein
LCRLPDRLAGGQERRVVRTRLRRTGRQELRSLYIEHWSEGGEKVRRKKAARKTRYTCPGCATNAWAKPGDAKLLDLRRFLSISCSKHQSSEGVDRCKADARTAARAADVVISI